MSVTYPWYGYVKRTYNVHKMFIYNIGIPKHKNTYNFLVQVRNFLLPLSLKVFRHKERDTPDFSICPKPRAHLSQGHRPGFGEPQKSTVFSRGRTQLTDFSQIS